jgi:hypothetical protein
VTSLQQVGRVCLVLGFTAAIPTATFGQGQDSIGARSLVYGGPSAGAPVLNAPFSADATLIFTRTLDDGSPTEQHAKARYYRDSAGRVRAEWVDIGLGGRDRTAGRYTSIWITPGDGWVYAMDLLDQTFRFFGSGYPATEMFHGGRRVIMPLGTDTYQVFFDSQDWSAVNDDVPLGERQIEGVNTIGRRLTEPMHGNGDAEIVEERWESTDLKIVIYSRLSDFRAGASVDYRLTNITRTEPPPQLFVVLPDMVKSGGVYSDDGRRRWIIRVRPSSR